MTLERKQLDLLSETDRMVKIRYVYAMFKDQSVVENYKISQSTFMKFVNDTEVLYSRHKNTFHNFDHGVTGTA